MIVSATPTLHTGIGGNRYVICSSADALFVVCDFIGKARSSIYFNRKFGCYVIRLKHKAHKQKAIEFFGRRNEDRIP